MTTFKEGGFLKCIKALEDGSIIQSSTSAEQTDYGVRLCYTIGHWDWYRKELLGVYYSDIIEMRPPTAGGRDLSKSNATYVCATRDGRIILSNYSSQDFTIQGYDVNNTLFMEIIDTEFRRVRKSETEIEQEIEDYRDYYSAYPMFNRDDVHVRPDPYKPSITNMFCDDEDRLWVRLGVFSEMIHRVYDCEGNTLFYTMLLLNLRLTRVVTRQRRNLLMHI